MQYYNDCVNYIVICNIHPIITAYCSHYMPIIHLKTQSSCNQMQYYYYYYSQTTLIKTPHIFNIPYKLYTPSTDNNYCIKLNWFMV